MTHLLLVSDIDDTIAGDEAALKRFTAWLGPSRGGTYHPRSGGTLTLAYASGRSVPSIAASIADGLPEPLAVLGSVGTDARWWPERTPVDGWPERLAALRFHRRALFGVLQEHPSVRMQPDEDQAPHKVSAYLPSATDEQLSSLSTALTATGSDIQIVYSSRRDLDVLPRGIDKGTAALHLAQQLGLSGDQLVVAGDSANDLAMFRAAERGIVVANARDDLLQRLGDAPVYRARQPRADGVREALERWLG